MKVPLKDFFLEKVLGVEKEPPSLNSLIKRAENMEREVAGQIKYIRNSRGKQDGLLGDQTAYYVENSKSYIRKMEDDSKSLTTGLQGYAKEIEDQDVYERLKQVDDTFQNGMRVFVDFVKENAPDGDIENCGVQINYLSKIVEMFEPDKRPRAPVVPIRDDIQIDYS